MPYSTTQGRIGPRRKFYKYTPRLGNTNSNYIIVQLPQSTKVPGKQAVLSYYAPMIPEKSRLRNSTVRYGKLDAQLVLPALLSSLSKSDNQCSSMRGPENITQHHKS